MLQDIKLWNKDARHRKEKSGSGQLQKCWGVDKQIVSISFSKEHCNQEVMISSNTASNSVPGNNLLS